MPLDAGDAGYGAAPGPKLPAGVGLSESAPLLAPEPEAQPAHRWKPLTTEELQVAAGGPGWRRTRCFLLAGFWLAWVAMLAVAVVVVVTSPRPAVRSLTWWQKALFYQVQPDLVTVKEDGSGGFSGEERRFTLLLKTRFSLRSEVNFRPPRCRQSLAHLTSPR